MPITGDLECVCHLQHSHLPNHMSAQCLMWPNLQRWLRPRRRSRRTSPHCRTLSDATARDWASALSQRKVHANFHCVLPYVSMAATLSVAQGMLCWHPSLMFDADCAAAGRGELRVIFTQIDQARPEQEFFFGVHMQDDDVYEG